MCGGGRRFPAPAGLSNSDRVGKGAASGPRPYATEVSHSVGNTSPVVGMLCIVQGGVTIFVPEDGWHSTKQARVDLREWS